MYCLCSQNKLFTGFISLKNTLAWGPFTLQPRSNPQVRDAAFTSALWTRHELEISGHFHSEHIIYLHHSSVIQTGFKSEVWGHFHSNVVVVVEMLLYIHRNRRLIRDGSPGRPPRLSHSSWALFSLQTHHPSLILPHHSSMIETADQSEVRGRLHSKHVICLLYFTLELCDPDSRRRALECEPRSSLFQRWAEHSPPQV